MPKRADFGHTAAKSLYFLFAGRFFSLIFLTLAFILVARLLGPSSYGVYSLAYGITTTMVLVTNFGIGSYLNKRMPELLHHGDKRATAHVFSSSYLTLVIVCTAVSLLLLALAGYLANDVFSAIGVSVLSIQLAILIGFTSPFQNTTYNALIGADMSNMASVSQSLLYLLYMTLSPLLIFLGFGVNGALAGLEIANLITIAVSTVYLFMKLKLRLVPPTIGGIKAAASFSAPIAVYNIVNNFAANFSVVLLGAFIAASALGNYGAAIRGLNSVVLLYSAITVLLIATFSKALAVHAKHAERQRRVIGSSYNKALYYSMLIMLPFIAYVSSLSQPLFYVAITKEFLLSPFYMSLMAIGTAINLIGLLTGSLLVAGGFVRQQLKYALVSFVVQLALLAVLVPSYGVLGAIAALFFVGSVLNSFLFVRAAKSLFHIEFHFGRIAKLFLANIILGIVLLPLLLLQHIVIEIALGLVATVLLYPLILILARAITTRDVDYMQEVTKRIPLLENGFGLMVSYYRLLSRAQ